MYLKAAFEHPHCRSPFETRYPGSFSLNVMITIHLNEIANNVGRGASMQCPDTGAIPRGRIARGRRLRVSGLSFRVPGNGLPHHQSDLLRALSGLVVRGRVQVRLHVAAGGAAEEGGKACRAVLRQVAVQKNAWNSGTLLDSLLLAQRRPARPGAVMATGQARADTAEPYTAVYQHIWPVCCDKYLDMVDRFPCEGYLVYGADGLPLCHASYDVLPLVRGVPSNAASSTETSFFRHFVVWPVSRWSLRPPRLLHELCPV